MIVKPRWLNELEQEYQHRIDELRKDGRGVSETMWRRLRLCKEGNVEELKRESWFLTYIYSKNELKTKGDKKMTKIKEENKKTKEKKPRITAKSVLVKLLSNGKIPTDAALITAVKEATGSALFGAKQLAWYRWKYELKRGNGEKKRIIIKKK